MCLICGIDPFRWLKMWEYWPLLGHIRLISGKKKHTLLIVSRLKQSEKGREHNIIGLIWEETKPVCGFSSITLYLIVVHFNQTELSVRKTNVWFVNHRTVVNPLLIDMKTALFYRFDWNSSIIFSSRNQTRWLSGYALNGAHVHYIRLSPIKKWLHKTSKNNKHTMNWVK